jgi:hypothetical protein
MPSSTSLAGLTKWLGRDEWHEDFEEILWLHVGPACERAGITFDDVAGILGPHWAMTLWGGDPPRMLAHRIGDPRVLRPVRAWLEAGNHRDR